jgi:hypothetical protein
VYPLQTYVWNSICFGQFLCPSLGVFHCTYNNGILHTGLLTVCEQDQYVPSWSCSKAVCKILWHIPLLCVKWKTPDDGQRNCPKHVEFHSKNKFEKLVHLVGFIIRTYHDARWRERQNMSMRHEKSKRCPMWKIYSKSYLAPLFIQPSVWRQIKIVCRREFLFADFRRC